MGLVSSCPAGTKKADGPPLQVWNLRSQTGEGQSHRYQVPIESKEASFRVIKAERLCCLILECAGSILILRRLRMRRLHEQVVRRVPDLRDLLKGQPLQRAPVRYGTKH